MLPQSWAPLCPSETSQDETSMTSSTSISNNIQPIRPACPRWTRSRQMKSGGAHVENLNFKWYKILRYASVRPLFLHWGKLVGLKGNTSMIDGATMSDTKPENVEIPFQNDLDGFLVGDNIPQTIRCHDDKPVGREGVRCGLISKWSHHYHNIITWWQYHNMLLTDNDSTITILLRHHYMMAI